MANWIDGTSNVTTTSAVPRPRGARTGSLRLTVTSENPPAGKDRVTVLSPTTVAVAGVPPSLNVQVYTDWNVASAPGWAVNVAGTPGTIPGGAVTVSW